MRYIKGIKNHANTLSRYPVNYPDEEDIATVGKSTEIVAITRTQYRQMSNTKSCAELS